MKTKIKIFIAAIMAAVAMSASAQKFDEISTLPDFNYSYISPTMLSAMANRTFESNDISIPANKLHSVEIISTISQGTDERFWQAIRKVIKEDKMETLTTNKTYNTRYDLLGNYNDSNKELTSIMIINQNGGNMVTVTYIQGRLSLNMIDRNFNH